MNSQIQNMITVAIATLGSIAVVSIIRSVAELEDSATSLTMVALLASVIAIDVSKRLERHYDQSDTSE